MGGEDAGGALDTLTRRKLWPEYFRDRCTLPHERQDAIRASKLAWWCDDFSFSVTQISVINFPEREEVALSSVPTCLNLPTETIDQSISAGTRAVQANPVIGKFAAY